MGWKGESRRHSLSRKGIKTAGKPNLNTRLQKKFGRPKENIEDIVQNEIQDIISFNFLDAKIIDVKLWGSYLKGKETPQSDIDFLLEYEGDEREDDMFNVINAEENKIYLEGVPVDVNPIKAEKSGTIKEFLARGSPTEDLIVNENAKSHFGVTDSPYEAGYLLTDGTMLDFSDGHNQKWLDHGEIKAVLDANQTQRDFVNMGNIRMSVTPSHSTMLLQMKKAPTNSQRRKIARLMKGITGEILIDMYVQEADKVKIKSKRYTPFDNPTKVFNDIDWTLGAN